MTKRNIFKKRLRRMIQKMKKTRGGRRKKKTFKKQSLGHLRR